MKTYICVKETSIRCPRKNHTLLPYVLEQVKDYLDVTVITDSEELSNICKQYGVDYYMEETNVKISEFHAIYNLLEKSNLLHTDSEFILLPVTQPIRKKDVIEKVVEQNMVGYDVVTTYSKVSNRHIFLLNEDDTFKQETHNKKGCMCSEEKMADGAIYKMKNSYLFDLMQHEDVNHAFWHSKIKFIENTTPLFLDVDTPQDLEVFKMVTQ